MSEITAITAEDHKANLAHFTGCERPFYEPMFPRVLYTDGVKYMKDAMQANWLFTDLAVYLLSPLNTKNMKNDDRLEYFQIAILERVGTGALLKIYADTSNWNPETEEDEPAEPVYVQEYPYTDFPFDEFKLYISRVDQSRWIVLLPSEY